MKHSWWIIGFFVLTFVGDRLGGQLLESILLDSQFRYSRLYQGQAQADVLLVGNSRGLSFYQPYIEEMTGLSTFNISYSAMPMNLAEVLVKDYLNEYQKPKIMLVDVTICDRLNPQLIASFNCYASFSQDLFQLVYDTEPSVAIGGEISHLFRYNGEIFQRSLYYRNKLDEDWLLDREISERLKEDVVSVDTATVSLVPEMVSSLKRTVELALSKGIEVKLVVSPYYLPFAERITNLDEMVQLVERETGLPVYNYSKSIAEEKDFGDYQHINIRGSRTYIALMMKDGLLPRE